MLPFMSLLVLVLATSALSPVRGLEPLEVEGTSRSESSIRPRFKITPMTPGKVKVLAGLGVLKLAVVGIIVTSLPGGPHLHFDKNNLIKTAKTTSTQPTATPSTNAPSTSPSQLTPTIPPRPFARREVRILDRRGLSVDSSKSRINFGYNNQKM